MKGLGRGARGSCGPDLSGSYSVSSVVPSLPVLLPLCLTAQQGVCPGVWSLAGSGTLPTLAHPHIPFGPSRSRASSESELDAEGPGGGDGDPGLFPFPLPRGCSLPSSRSLPLAQTPAARSVWQKRQPPIAVMSPISLCKRRDRLELPVAQWIKDPALSLLWLRSLLWCRFSS